MDKLNLKKFLSATAVALVLSILSFYFYFTWFNNQMVDSNFELSFSQIQIIKNYLVWFIYYFSLIGLPFLSKVLILWSGAKQKDLWKIIISLEVFVFFFAYFFTPPDNLSTILVVILGQLIVIVNSISIKRNLSTTSL